MDLSFRAQTFQNGIANTSPGENINADGTACRRRFGARLRRSPSQRNLAMCLARFAWTFTNCAGGAPRRPLSHEGPACRRFSWRCMSTRGSRGTVAPFRLNSPVRVKFA